MKPIVVSEPRQLVRLYISAQEREDAEADLLLRAGGIKFVMTWIAVFVVCSVWAARYWLGLAH